MFVKKEARDYRTAMEGISIKTLSFGEKTLLTEFRLEKGAHLPLHSHPHEQTGYLISGKIFLTIGEETFEAVPGDSWCIPGDVKHCADIEEDSLVVEVFSPLREDYLP